MLWDAAEPRGPCSPLWLMYRHANGTWRAVPQGMQGTPIVYANTYTKTETSEDSNEVDSKIPFLEGYAVFNAQQYEDLPECIAKMKNKPVEPVQRIERADRFLSDEGADIRERGNRAYRKIWDTS